MPSIYWKIDPSTAFNNPYNYECQNQFCREVDNLLKIFYSSFQKYTMKYHVDNCSVEKAVWMLHMDALDSLRDALDALVIKKHRVAGKLYRDILETLDIAAYFHSRTDNAERDLLKWYDNKVVSHSRYRDYIEKNEGKEAAELKKEQYKELSLFTHRTYKVLLYGYFRGAGDMIWHDEMDNMDFPLSQQTVSDYLARLAPMIFKFTIETINRELLTNTEVKNILAKSFEPDTIPPRFVIR